MLLLFQKKESEISLLKLNLGNVRIKNRPLVYKTQGGDFSTVTGKLKAFTEKIFLLCRI